MIRSKPNPYKKSRSANTIVCVLVVILLVGMLSMQVIQTLALIRRGDDQRAKIIQANALSEYAKSIDWNAADAQMLTMQVPSSVNSVDEPETQAAIIERQIAEDNPQAARIVVRFPADKLGEIKSTAEIENE